MHRELSDAEVSRRAEIVARDYGGVLPYFETMYLHSILYATGRSLDSFERFQRLKDPQEDPEHAVSVIQEAVGHAAAVSRFFWPVKGSHREPPAVQSVRKSRGQRLRAAFAVSGESPLANRSVRNTWEHFDERLDRYLLHVDAGIMLPGCIVESHEISDDPLGHTFKVLDPAAECLVLLGERFFYGAIRDEVARVHHLAVEADRNGGRLPQAQDAV